ncbi:MAG: hypothetical protein Q4A82_06435 [Corynebacterium sp.]|nr:hypothetical protein [Corynebacterium sp.]
MMKRATYLVAALALCGALVAPPSATAQSVGSYTPYQVPKPADSGLLKWAEDVFTVGRTSPQDANQCAASTALAQYAPTQPVQCSTREIGFVEFIAASIVHLMAKIAKPVPGYQGVTPARPTPISGEVKFNR